MPLKWPLTKVILLVRMCCLSLLFFFSSWTPFAPGDRTDTIQALVLASFIIKMINFWFSFKNSYIWSCVINEYGVMSRKMAYLLSYHVLISYKWERSVDHWLLCTDIWTTTQKENSRAVVTAPSQEHGCDGRRHSGLHWPLQRRCKTMHSTCHGQCSCCSCAYLSPAVFLVQI